MSPIDLAFTTSYILVPKKPHLYLAAQLQTQHNYLTANDLSEVRSSGTKF